MLEEGRRHSVDIPISHTLKALMRSRSLRDPDTNSLSKFNSLLEKSNREFKESKEFRTDINNLSRHSISCAWHAHLENRIEDFEGLECKNGDFSSSSLNEKYKPRSFDELIGQHSVVKSLHSAISKGKFLPVYLLSGPNGSGKSSCARILAAGINCQSVNSPKPCGFCHNCVLVFSNKCRDVKQFEGSNLNSKSKIASLIKTASFAPLKLQFMVFIVQNCENLGSDAWNSLITKLELIPKYLVLIMLTASLENLPNKFVQKCQIYRFGKIESNYVVNKLRFICMKEGFNFEEDALDLLARKCDGSIRDAINALDQLNLIGKRITRSNLYELVGDISEEELIELLKLSFNSDAASIVIRAREIMSSKVDPTQLASQLANLIMDILSGKCQPGQTLAGLGAQRLRNALEILSETVKQLKAAKNPSTWLTAALLQFNSTGETPVHSVATTPFAKLPTQLNSKPDDELMRTELNGNCENGDMNHSEHHLKEPEILEIIWTRVVENCAFKDLLLKDAKLSSIYFYQGMAIAEIEICNGNYDSIKSEKLVEQIATSFQSVLGCNVEIKINPSLIERELSEPPNKYEEIIVTSLQNEEIDRNAKEIKSQKSCCNIFKGCFKRFFACNGLKSLFKKCCCFEKLCLCCARSKDYEAARDD